MSKLRIYKLLIYNIKNNNKYNNDNFDNNDKGVLKPYLLVCFLRPCCVIVIIVKTPFSLYFSATCFDTLIGIIVFIVIIQLAWQQMHDEGDQQYRLHGHT